MLVSNATHQGLGSLLFTVSSITWYPVSDSTQYYSKRLTMGFISMDHCCSQVDKQEWGLIHKSNLCALLRWKNLLPEDDFMFSCPAVQVINQDSLTEMCKLSTLYTLHIISTKWCVFLPSKHSWKWLGNQEKKYKWLSDKSVKQLRWNERQTVPPSIEL